MKKILFIINQLYAGGAEKALINLFNNLDEEIYDIDFIIYDHEYGDRVDLIEDIPEYINVCITKSDFFSQINNLFLRFISKYINKKLYNKQFKTFTRNKYYDIAISFGEWFVPDFLVKFVNSDKKIIWIHTDIIEAEFFYEDKIFQFDSYIDLYVFVSEESRKSALKKYKFIEEKSVVVHNIIDTDKIEKRSKEYVEFNFRKPVILMVGNLRTEKNHILALETMKILVQEGFQGTWINIGSKVDKSLFSRLYEKVKQYNLEESFLFLGGKQNPYNYINKSDLIVSLSKFESWSMVISEALYLDKFVISTDTSGAREQIINNVNGFIVDSNAISISKKIKEFLKSEKKTNNYKINYSFRDEFLKIENYKKKESNIIYIIDNINYNGGAHFATFNQIRYLYKFGYDISILTETKPRIEIRNLLFKSRIYKLDGRDKDVFFKIINKFNTIIVLSEGSKYREYVSKIPNKKKIQYIHTNYKLWSSFNSYTKKITKKDSSIYENFDSIIFVSEISRIGFLEKYPNLENITITISNIIDVKKIKKLADKNENLKFYLKDRLNIITIARLEEEKGIYNIIKLSKYFKERNLKFVWNIVGDGNLKEDIIKDIKKNDLEKEVILCGYMDNPYALLKKSDVFILLSKYEGIPNTIFESFILQVPVIANDVGGIREQVLDERYGRLININNQNSFDIVLRSIENNLLEFKTNLSKYVYDNDKNIYKFISILEN